MRRSGLPIHRCCVGYAGGRYLRSTLSFSSTYLGVGVGPNPLPNDPPKGITDGLFLPAMRRQTLQKGLTVGHRAGYRAVKPACSRQQATSKQTQKTRKEGTFAARKTFGQGQSCRKQSKKTRLPTRHHSPALREIPIPFLRSDWSSAIIEKSRF